MLPGLDAKTLKAGGVSAWLALLTYHHLSLIEKIGDLKTDLAVIEALQQPDRPRKPKKSVSMENLFERIHGRLRGNRIALENGGKLFKRNGSVPGVAKLPARPQLAAQNALDNGDRLSRMIQNKPFQLFEPEHYPPSPGAILRPDFSTCFFESLSPIISTPCSHSPFMGFLSRE